MMPLPFDLIFGAVYNLNATVLGVLIALYAVVIGYLGIRGFRKTKSAQDYLLAGRSVNPFVMAMSYGAAFISTSALVGFGGIAGQFGMGLMWLVFMNIAFGIVLAFIVFGHRTRSIGVELDAKTFPEFIGRRFQSSTMKYFIAAVIFIFIPLYSSVVLISGARFLQEVMGVPYSWALGIFAAVVAIYVIFGGLKGVMYVDALMGTVMICGMLLLIIMCYVRLGGVVPAHEKLTEMSSLVAQRLPQEYALGHRGWTVMPEFNSVWWWTLVSSLMLGVGVGALAQPQLAVRFMTVKSGRELNRAVMVGSIFILCTAGSAYMTGALSNVFFMHPEIGLSSRAPQLAIEAAGGNPDLIIPMFIKEALPPVVLYIFSLTMLSAAMSTLSSLFHVAGTSLGHDLCGRLSCKSLNSMNISRIGVCIGIVLSVVFAMILPPGVVARGTAIFFGICAAAFLPAYVAALYWKRATRAGIWAGVVSGSFVTVFGLLFLHRKEAAWLGICKYLTGREVLVDIHPFPVVDPFVYALPISVIALIAVTLLTTPPDKEHIDRLFK